MRDTFRAFTECEVPFTIATDGPEMMRTTSATSSSCFEQADDYCRFPLA